MKIIVPKETAPFENRVALSIEVAKKLVDLGHEVVIEKDAGTAAGMTNEAYESVGAKISKDTKSLYDKVSVVVRVSPPTSSDIAAMPSGCILIGLLKPYGNEKLAQELATKKITSFALEFVPRISRAQAMDVLSSQSNLAGYKAVVDASSEFGRAMPMMMTAAGMIPPARALILGAGVAGLQAIATARRLGAIVSAFDVRSAAKEQVESLGAIFVEVPSDEVGDSTGGYAKEMSADYKKRQQEKLEEVMAQQDIVISTALIPGRPAPKLITEAMVQKMKPGSIIVDLAVETGGNCTLSQIGKIVVKHGVKIIGYPNYPSCIPFDASQVYARNVLSFIKLLLDKDGKKFEINWEDEIINSTCLSRDHLVVHSSYKVPKAVKSEETEKKEAIIIKTKPKIQAKKSVSSQKGELHKVAKKAPQSSEKTSSKPKALKSTKPKAVKPKPLKSSEPKTVKPKATPKTPKALLKTKED